MKLPSEEEFNFKDVVVGGDDCWLITPNDMSTKWTDDNARFRSCIIRKSDHFVVSQGFGKFTNFGERPEFQPWDESWKVQARHKLDGSLLIVSKYKGELILRTRGTVDARQLDNGHEINSLIKRYPKAFDNEYLDREDVSLLCEWTTPTNIIVLREHEVPTLTLVGIVGHISCKYATQKFLDTCGVELGVGRPDEYEYDSIAECIADVAAWSGKEGVVLSSPDGQTLKKIKADEYCELHKLTTGIKGVKQVLEVFLASPRFTDYDSFYKYIEATLDYEIAEKCKDYINDIVDAWNSYIEAFNKIKHEVDVYISPLDTRKDQAVAINTKYKTSWGKSLAFILLDNREVDDKLVLKAMNDLLKL